MGMPLLPKGHHSLVDMYLSMELQLKSEKLPLLPPLPELKLRLKDNILRKKPTLPALKQKKFHQLPRVTTFTPGSGGVHDKYAPIEQDLYPQYDCYNVNILDPVYNTKAKVATYLPTNTCYCGRVCSNPASLKSHHDRRHSQGDYECDYYSSNLRHTWKHHRTQHLYIYTHTHTHTHMCKVRGGYKW